jgi:hypothetical protein
MLVVLFNERTKNSTPLWMLARTVDKNRGSSLNEEARKKKE